MITCAAKVNVVFGVPACSCATVSEVKNTTQTNAHVRMHACTNTHKHTQTHPKLGMETHLTYRPVESFWDTQPGHVRWGPWWPWLTCRLCPAWHRARLSDVNTHTLVHTWSCCWHKALLCLIPNITFLQGHLWVLIIREIWFAYILPL